MGETVGQSSPFLLLFLKPNNGIYGCRFFHQLFISPHYQRRGVGTKLIEHGLKHIQSTEAQRISEIQGNDNVATREREPLVIGLTSSPQGKGLYERYGFEVVYWFNPTFMDYNKEGELVEKSTRWPLMIRRG